MACVVVNHADVLKIADEMGIPKTVAAAKIGMWQDEHGLDKWPTVDDLQLKLKTDKDNIESNKVRVYQGRKSPKFENRTFQYYTADINEAKDYGTYVNSLEVDLTDFLIRENEGEKTYQNLRTEFKKITNKDFDILDNSNEGLKTQSEFFEFLKNKGYKGLAFYSVETFKEIEKLGNKSGEKYDSQYIVVFDETKSAQDLGGKVVGNIYENEKTFGNEKNNTISGQIKKRIEQDLPKEISDAVIVIQDVPKDILGNPDLFFSLKEILNDKGINDELLINWLGINNNKLKILKSITSEKQIEQLAQNSYNQRVKNAKEIIRDNKIKQSFDNWTSTLKQFPIAFQDLMLKHAIKNLINPDRTNKFVLELSEVSLQNTFRDVKNQPHKLNQVGRIYNENVLKTVSDATGHEPSASGKGYWIHIPRVSSRNYLGYSSYERFKDVTEQEINKIENNQKELILPKDLTEFTSDSEFLDIKYKKIDNKWYKIIEGDKSEISIDDIKKTYSYQQSAYHHPDDTIEKLNKLKKSLKEEVPENWNTASQHKANVELLRKLSPQTWCTASSMASHYVENYDNYILVVDGQTVAGVEAGQSKTNEGELQEKIRNLKVERDYLKNKGQSVVNIINEIDRLEKWKPEKIQVKEVTSRANNGIAPIDHLDDILAFFEKHNLDTDNESINNAINARKQGKSDKDVSRGDERDELYGWEDNFDPGEHYAELQQQEEQFNAAIEKVTEDAKGLKTPQDVITYLNNNNDIGMFITPFVEALPKELIDNRIVADRLIEKDSHSINFIDQTLPFYKDLAHKAVQANGAIFEYISPEAKLEQRNIDLHNTWLENNRNRANDDLPFSKTSNNQIQGYYDAKNDKVVVVAKNTPVNEAAQVAIHEVAHRGMLRMAKDLGGVKELHKILKGAREQFLKKLPELLERTGHKDLKSLMLDYGFEVGKDGKLTEEGEIKLYQELAARWAESLVDKPKPSWWKEILQKIGDWIKQFAGITLNEKQVDELVGGFVKYGTKNLNNQSTNTSLQFQKQSSLPKHTTQKRVSSFLKNKVGVSYALITEEKAKELTDGKWNGEPGFYYQGHVYLVKNNFDTNTQFHEFSHPFVNALYLNNPDLFWKLWNDLLETEQGIKTFLEVEKLYKEHFDQDGDPKLMAVAEVMTTILGNAAEAKYAEKSLIRQWIDKFLAAIKSMLNMHDVKVSEFSLDTTMGQLAEMMADDTTIDLEVNPHVMQGEPQFSRIFENTAKQVKNAWSYVNAIEKGMQEKKQVEADKDFENTVLFIENYFGNKINGTDKNITKRRKQEIPFKKLLDEIDPVNTEAANEKSLTFWENEFYNYGTIPKDVDAAKKMNELIDEERFLVSRFGSKDYSAEKLVEANEYNREVIEKEYQNYKFAHEKVQEIMKQYPDEASLVSEMQNLSSDKAKKLLKTIKLLEDLGEEQSFFALRKLRAVYTASWLYNRMKKENAVDLTTREKRMFGPAATYYIAQFLEGKNGFADPDISWFQSRIQSPLFQSDNAIQLANIINGEAKYAARNHYETGKKSLESAYDFLKQSGNTSFEEFIIELPSGLGGEMKEFFLGAGLNTGDETSSVERKRGLVQEKMKKAIAAMAVAKEKIKSSKKSENQKTKEAFASLSKEDQYYWAMNNYLRTWFSLVEKAGVFNKNQKMFYAVPQNTADALEIIKKSGTDISEGLKELAYTETDPESYLDNINVSVKGILSPPKTETGTPIELKVLQYATAKRMLLNRMKRGIIPAAYGAVRMKVLRARVEEIMQKAKTNPNGFTFDDAGMVLIPPIKSTPLGAPFTKNIHRTKNIHAALVNYYHGMTYKGAIDTAIPALKFIQSKIDSNKKENLRVAFDTILDFKIFKEKRLQRSGPVLGLILEQILMPWSIARALGLNIWAQKLNVTVGQIAFFREHGLSGYSMVANRLWKMNVTKDLEAKLKKEYPGLTEEKFKNLKFLYNLARTYTIVDNLGIINVRNHLALSVSEKTKGTFSKLFFLPTEIGETLIQFPQILYHITDEELQDYNEDGILMQGKKGIGAGKILLIEKEIARMNGAYSETALANYRYDLEGRMLGSLKHWAVQLGTETFGKKRTIQGMTEQGFVSGFGSFLTNKDVYYNGLEAVKLLKKGKEFRDIPVIQQFAVLKMARLTLLTIGIVMLLDSLTGDDDDDKEKKKEVDLVKNAILESVSTDREAGIARTLTKAEPVIDLSTDIGEFIWNAGTGKKYEKDATYGLDKDYVAVKDAFELFPATSFFKRIVLAPYTEKRKEKKELLKKYE